jgi:hypothetical protein
MTEPNTYKNLPAYLDYTSSPIDQSRGFDAVGADSKKNCPLFWMVTQQHSQLALL